jgi:ankyrin repeat protein
MRALNQVLEMYRSHPDFLGLELTSAGQKGAVDDTPLHIAARRGDIEDISDLVAHGADVNDCGDLHNTPLHSAALTGQSVAVRKLLDLGANQFLTNEFLETPLEVARRGGHQEVVVLLAAADPGKG